MAFTVEIASPTPLETIHNHKGNTPLVVIFLGKGLGYKLEAPMDLIVNLVVIEDLQPSLCEVVGGVRLRHVEEGNIKPLHLPVFVDEVGSHDDVRIICAPNTLIIFYFPFLFLNVCPPPLQ